MNFKHLSLEERHYIEISLKNGISMNKIAKNLGRLQSTISREIARNTGQRGYRHKQAHTSASMRHTTKNKAVKVSTLIKDQVSDLVKAKWSPEQIAGRLKADGIISLHHETIYQIILKDKKGGGKLYTHLRHQNKTYRKRYGNGHNSTGIPNRVDIEEREKEANNRERVGDWEFDTVIGRNHKGALVTMDERKTKIRLALPIERKTAENTTAAINQLLLPIKKFVLTGTFDNGKEFAQHTKIAQVIGCKTYFAKPYHSWERGQNENANGLLRQYFPKKMELTGVSENDVIKAVDALNNRPRKCLGYRTPYEAFEKETGVNLRNLLGYAFMT